MNCSPEGKILLYYANIHEEFQTLQIATDVSKDALIF